MQWVIWLKLSKPLPTYLIDEVLWSSHPTSASMIIGILKGAGVVWELQGWQSFLLNAGYLIACGLVISTPATRSPKLWTFLGVFALGLYLVICISLLVSSDAKVGFPEIINRFENHSDFNNDGFVFLMGWSLMSLAFGAEASAHMAEETQQPASNVPKALFYSTLISYVLGCILNLCLSAVSLLFTS